MSSIEGLQQPNWLFVSNYEAETTVTDKVSRVVNNIVFGNGITQGLNNDIRYLFIADRSFSRLSTVAGAIVGRIVEPIFYAVGTEWDGVAAAQKLSRLGIEQVIIQHNSDEGELIS